MAREKKPEEVKPGAPEYMNTYGDLVTLLLCFFVLLFASSTVDAQKFNAMVNSFTASPINSGGKESVLDLYGSGIMQMPSLQEIENAESNEVQKQEKSREELEKMKTDFLNHFAEQNISDKTNLKIEDNATVITFAEGVLFDKGQAVLKPEAIAILGIVADELILYPESDIEIVGHTDNDPINTPQFPNNWYLSAARAIQVNMFFIEERGFAPEKIIAVGHGEYDPVVLNDSPENKEKNRRVELKVKSSVYSNI